MHFKNLLFLLTLFLVSCTTNTSEPPEEGTNSISEDIPSQPKASPISQEPTKLIVNLENLRLRAEAGEKGKEISRLAKGTILTEAGEISDFTTRLKLRGIPFNEPWIKVKTESGQEGWVYGGGVNFSMENPTALANKLMEHRLQTLFGGVAPSILAYQAAYTQTSTSSAFLKNFREGTALRDSLTKIIEDKIVVGDYKQLPDLFWLKEALPGYTPQLVAEGTAYYLFQDYKQMEAVAQKTQGLEDDNFMDLCFMVHSFDSIEHFYPSWFLQTWDYGGNSLLGQGVHLRILEKMEDLHKNDSPFTPEINALKDRLIHDITWNETSFWEPISNMKKELDSIIKGSFTILTPEDQIALQTRRKMFEDPKANKIQVNLKSGH